MLEGVLLIGGMTACALIPMAWMTYLMIRGKSGLVLTVISILGAMFAILYFGTETPIGIDFVQAWAIALLFVLPATLGAFTGTLLGWMIRRRRERRP